MGSKSHFSFLGCVLSFAVAALFACEDNPEECYSDDDCGEGYVCEATYYNSGSRSGGICHKIETEEDGGENDAGDEPKGTDDASIQDSSNASSVNEASTEASAPVDADGDADAPEAAVSGDAASDATGTDGGVAVEGGQPQQPADSGNGDSAN